MAKTENNTFFMDEDIFIYNQELEQTMIEYAKRNKNKNSRICLHNNNREGTQNMIIFLMPHSSFEPHYHPNGKKESYTILKGKLFVEIFDEKGYIKETLILSRENTPYSHKGGIRHRPFTKEDLCIYQEVYHGTYNKENDVLKFPVMG